jgi:hypothetical protein
MAEGTPTTRTRHLRSALVRVVPFVGMLALYALLGLALWWLLNWYIEPDKAEQPSTAKKDLLQALGFLMAGVAGAVGIYFTWRNLSRTRESTERTLWLTEQGQITERFTRAIDQLGATADDGNPKLEIRLGGIYALERIARDSPEWDYSTVMKVLTAYVRENAKWTPPDDPKGTGHRGQGEEQSVSYSPQVPRADIRAIIDVLRREKHHIPQRYWVSHDLTAANLIGAKLWGARLEGARLEGANLFGAHLGGASGLSQSQIELAVGDKTTKLPKGLARPASWSPERNSRVEPGEVAE